MLGYPRTVPLEAALHYPQIVGDLFSFSAQLLTITTMSFIGEIWRT